MKKYDIRYVGNKGTVDLNTAPYLIKNIETLFESEISFNSTSYQLDNRNDIDSFYFNGTEKDIEIQVYRKNKEELIMILIIFLDMIVRLLKQVSFI